MDSKTIPPEKAIEMIKFSKEIVKSINNANQIDEVIKKVVENYPVLKDVSELLDEHTMKSADEFLSVFFESLMEQGNLTETSELMEKVKTIQNKEQMENFLNELKREYASEFSSVINKIQ